jgi:hypothetical protein
MESLVRNVGDIDAHDRQALEHVLGQALRENQQLVIHIVNLNVQPETVETPVSDHDNPVPELPEWCRVYEGLSDEEVADMEKTILQRADFSRSTD